MQTGPHHFQNTGDQIAAQLQQIALSSQSRKIAFEWTNTATEGQIEMRLHRVCFWHSPPTLWKSLPQSVVSDLSICTFKSHLKTVLHSWAFCWMHRDRSELAILHTMNDITCETNHLINVHPVQFLVTQKMRLDSWTPDLIWKMQLQKIVLLVASILASLMYRWWLSHNTSVDYKMFCNISRQNCHCLKEYWNVFKSERKVHAFFHRSLHFQPSKVFLEPCRK